jgi:glycosyltransferase involved in cell wall biosynthesis
MRKFGQVFFRARPGLSPGRRCGAVQSGQAQRFSGKPLPPGVSIKLLYVGRVSREKDLELLGRAFKTLAQAHNNLHLVVVGDGPYLEKMRQDLADTPCLFTGYLEGEDLAEVFASCDLFLFPSTTDTFGNVVLEAQASGLPVIVTDSGRPQENVLPGKTGLIVPGHNEAALRRAVEELIADPARLQEMGRTARDYVRKRFFENAFDHAWQMYKERAEGY